MSTQKRFPGLKVCAWFILLGFVTCLYAAAARPAATPARGTTARGAATSSPAKFKGFFWKVTSPTTEMYLLGSIHAASEDTYPLPAEIETAFKNSSVVVAELDITKVDQMAMAMQLMQKGMYPAGDSLDKHVSPETMKAFQKFCEDNQLPADLFKQMRPGLAATTVVAMVMQKLGMNPELGVDKHFLELAHKDDAGPNKKRIIELETVDEQLKLLFDLDDKLADASMLEDLKDTNGDQLTKLMKAWQTGDIKTVEGMILQAGDDEATRKVLDVMIYQRNDKMAKTLADLLKGREKVFVVVGAAHLLGDRGILKQLEKQNFKVEQIELTNPAPAK